MEQFHGTTIVAVRKNGRLAVAGDGQVSLGNQVVKHRARKVRRIYHDKIIVGFAGATADALTLSEKLEGRLDRYNGNLTRSAVELAREWRTDKYLRRLEAMMIAADESALFLLSGNGDVMEPDEGIAAIGSGSAAAQAAAAALMAHTDMNAREIAETALKIAADICIYTNGVLTVEEAPPASTSGDVILPKS
ncbi:MAG: HslU--HslV peptidase proteolytic subunit [Desulfobacterales bacterium]|nr:MAG: HslU--HslV peptidase proteolytic subunit [Desulfobacterales bacterium]